MRIGIAGAGGLGSNVAVNLVRTGVKKLKIVDFDVVDESNLNRQFYFMDQVGRPKVEALRENLLRIRITSYNVCYTKLLRLVHNINNSRNLFFLVYRKHDRVNKRHG